MTEIHSIFTQSSIYIHLHWAPSKLWIFGQANWQKFGYFVREKLRHGMSMTICVLIFRWFKRIGFPASQKTLSEVFKPHHAIVDHFSGLKRLHLFDETLVDGHWNNVTNVWCSVLWMCSYQRDEADPVFRVSRSKIIRTSIHHNISEIQGTTCPFWSFSTLCGKVTKRPISRRGLDPEGKQSGKTSRMNHRDTFDIRWLIFSSHYYYNLQSIYTYRGYRTTIAHQMYNHNLLYDISYYTHLHIFCKKETASCSKNTHIKIPLSCKRITFATIFFKKKTSVNICDGFSNVRNTHGTMSGIPRSLPGKMPRCTGECWETQSRKGVTKKSAVVVESCTVDHIMIIYNVYMYIYMYIEYIWYIWLIYYTICM